MTPNTPPTIRMSRAVTILISTAARSWNLTSGNRMVMRPFVARAPTVLDWMLAAPVVGPAFFIHATRESGAGAGSKKVIATNSVTSTLLSFVQVGEAGAGMEVPKLLETCAPVQTKRPMKGQRGRKEGRMMMRWREATSS